MKNCFKKAAIVLLLSTINLAIMIPGGPVETRTFNSYSTFIILAFNIFLTLLGFISLMGIYGLFKEKKWSTNLGMTLGALYFLVFLSDLLHVFPVSDTKMSIPLVILEIIGLVLALFVIIFSYLGKKQAKLAKENKIHKLSTKSLVIITMFIILGVLIITFATLNALR